MCLFPRKNVNINSPAYKAGLIEFECGKCPECLAKRSNQWALRCSMESKSHAHNCMITLTYDSFKRDENGNLIKDKNGNPIENPVDPTLKVSKRHCQLFIKRLRSYFKNQKIKYFLSAEYGNSTHRAHYHCILFGVKFSDLVRYKKSKRGNIIYFSHTLFKLWAHGICTVDSINIGPSIARYCSKYCCKDRSNETFSLFSQGIGLDFLLKRFNGLYYMLEGRKYTIPKIVWQHYITDKYKNITNFPFDYRYVNRDRDLDEYDSIYDRNYYRQKMLNENYRTLRDNDNVYKRYIDYWREFSSRLEQRRPSIRARLLALPNSKYGLYKARALRYYDMQIISKHLKQPELHESFDYSPCRISSCHNTASDRFKEDLDYALYAFELKLMYMPLPKGDKRFFWMEEGFNNWYLIDLDRPIELCECPPTDFIEPYSPPVYEQIAFTFL